MSKSWRRSLSASRSPDTSTNFVGRIGASLRISSRKRAREKQKQHQDTNSNLSGDSSESWLRSGVHYAKVGVAKAGVERRRSACSAIFLGAKNAPKLCFADEAEEEEMRGGDHAEDENVKNGAQKSAGLETHHYKRYQVRSNSVVTSRDRRLALFNQRSAVNELRRGSTGANTRNEVRASRSSVDFGAELISDEDDDDEDDDLPSRYIDASGCEGEEDEKSDYYSAYYAKSDYDKNENDEEDCELALVPLPYASASPAAALRAAAAVAFMTRSAVSSPLNATSSGCGGGANSFAVTGAPGTPGAAISQSCPSTPQAQPRRRYLREGATQLTSLATLCTHHRYLFLFNDLLLVSKQKGENSYKLKEKVSLDRLWISSNNCTHSFLIGWPIQNFVAHFSSESEKNEWFTKLNDCIKRRHLSQRPRSTTISVVVRIEGRQQLIRREIENGIRASQLVQQLIDVLDLPTIDPHLFRYELCFEFGGSSNAQPANANSSGGGHIIDSSSGGGSANGSANGRTHCGATTALENDRSGTLNLSASANIYASSGTGHNSVAGASFLTGGPSAQITALNGVESVYAILMDHVFNSGISLSDSQLAHLDTCPHVNCRLVLRKTANSASASSGATSGGVLGGQSRSNTALNLVNHFRKVLSRVDSSQQKRLFSRQLAGSMPPQPVLTMIDHLTIYGAHVEGLFRKCAKQATVRELKAQLNQGQVPDFHQFNVHVTASLLKEYLRSIPGQLLISANYHLWMEVVGAMDGEKRLRTCKNLLRLLPPSHTVLLRSVLRLLRRVAAASETSKMNVNCLAVCLAPSLLENPNVMDSARRVPDLAAYLINNANELFDEFVDDTLIVPSAGAEHNGHALLLPVGSSTAGSTTGSDEGANGSHSSGGDGVPHYGFHHHSTDSGLSDDLLPNNGNGATIVAQDSQHASRNSRLGACAQQIPRSTSVSPDSALFEIPTSEASSSSSIGIAQSADEDDSAESIHSETNWSGRIRQMSHTFIQIDATECTQPNYATVLVANENENDSDDRTPVLSRENSDVKTQFPNRYQWRSHLSSEVGETGQSPDVSTAAGAADVRVMRLKPNATSVRTNSSTTSSIISSTRAQVDGELRAQQQSKQNIVANVDELRVSDFIISAHNGEKRAVGKVFSNATQDREAELDELYAAIGGNRSFRKISNTSSQTPNGRKISAASTISAASGASQLTPRRSALVTKNETLGISVQSTAAIKNDSGTVKRATQAIGRKPALHVEASPYAFKVKSTPEEERYRITKERKFSPQDSQTIAPKLKRTNSSSVKSNLSSVKQRTSNSNERNKANENTKIASISHNASRGRTESRERSVLAMERRSSARDMNFWQNAASRADSKGRSSPKENEKPLLSALARVARRQSDRRPNTTTSASSAYCADKRKTSSVAGDNLQTRKSIAGSTTTAAADKHSTIASGGTTTTTRPWRPPKRTAEEIVLDKSLEVNWSVSSIRSVFQQQKDDKPTAIDTVYAKFDAKPTHHHNF